MATTMTKKTKQNQIDKFKQAARNLECEDSEKAFERKLKKIARAAPKEKTGTPGK